MESFATRHLKTYQVWHHRKLLLIELNNPRAELLFISNALLIDAKNYHTWAYRQWILDYFSPNLDTGGEEDAELGLGLGRNVWEEEIKYVEEMIEADLRNNSAWHHRFFVVSHLLPSGFLDEEVLRNELRYTKSKISLAPSNLSAWNYLRGILDKAQMDFYDPGLLKFVEPFTRVRSGGTNVVESGLKSGLDNEEDNEEDLDNPLPGERADLPCVYAVEFMADALVRKCAAEIGVGAKEEEEEEEEKDKDKGKDKDGNEKRAVELFGLLAESLDPMRKAYWNYRAAQLISLDRLEAGVKV